MELFFYQNNGKWSVDIATNQGSMPAVLNDQIKDAVRKAVDSFNKD